MKLSAVFQLGFVFVTALAMSACATKDTDYLKTSQVPPLEVPPDLSSPAGEGAYGGVPLIDTDAVSASGASTGGRTPVVNVGGAVLQDFKAVRMQRAGGQRWLVVQAQPEPLWFEIRAFLLKNGFLIAKQNPKTGIMETEWRESRPLVAGKVKNKLSKALGSLYSTGMKDKFRIRLERGLQDGTMEIYISHRGVEEVVASGGGIDVVETRWQPRASDPELEVELLRLLMVYLGEDGSKINRLLASSNNKGDVTASVGRNSLGAPVLNLQTGFDEAWRRVGLSLDRVGFTVEDRDRSNGLYYVRYQDSLKDKKKKGIFASLFGGDKEKAKQYYQVSIKGTEARTEVQVLDQNGVVEISKTGERILGLLQQQLN